MAFFTSGVSFIKTAVVLVGAGIGGYGVVNLLEGYGSDNPGAKSQGIKQFFAGAAIALVGIGLIPLLSDLFTAP